MVVRQGQYNDVQQRLQRGKTVSDSSTPIPLPLEHTREPHPGGKTVGEVIVPANSLGQIAEIVPFQEGRVVPHTLFDAPGVRLIHIALDRGTALKEHMTQFPIVVEVVEGEIEFEVNGNRTQFGTGGLIHLEASLLHAVHATTRARINIYLVKAAKG